MADTEPTATQYWLHLNRTYARHTRDIALTTEERDGGPTRIAWGQTITPSYTCLTQYEDGMMAAFSAKLTLASHVLTRRTTSRQVHLKSIRQC